MEVRDYTDMTADELRQYDEYLLEVQNMGLNNGEFDYVNTILDLRTDIAMHADERGVAL